MKLKIAIVGAGISGLTAGILLKKLGHDVSIFEKSSSISEYGAGINLSRNATILLERSGLLEGLKDISQYPSRSIIRNFNIEYDDVIINHYLYIVPHESHKFTKE